jgi:hypothetical protein
MRKKRRWIRYSILDCACIIFTDASVLVSVIVQTGLPNMQTRAITHEIALGKATRWQHNYGWNNGSRCIFTYCGWVDWGKKMPVKEALQGQSTRVRIHVQLCVRFQVWFAFKPNRDPILHLKLISMVGLHISVNIYIKFKCNITLTANCSPNRTLNRPLTRFLTLLLSRSKYVRYRHTYVLSSGRLCIS